MSIYSLKNYLQNLDLFEESSNDGEPINEQEKRSNIIATRVYIVVLILILISLGFYFSLSSKITKVTVTHPTEAQLNRLPPNSQCFCSQISVPYGKFTSLQPILHQVCSSEFVSNRWISALFTGSNVTYFSLNDFRNFATAQFQALSAYCRLSIANIQQSIASFNQNILISSQLLSQTALELQVNSTSDQFLQIASKTFTAQLELMHQVSASNKLISGLQTNYIISYSYYPQVESTKYQSHNGSTCDCALDILCESNAIFDSVFGASTRYATGQQTFIPGMTSGCLPMSSIRASTLECFYNQTCVDYLISYFPTTDKFSAMNLTNRTRYHLQATIKSMVDNLMIEDWIIDTSYQKYYNVCAPSLCTYSKEERNDLVFVITKLISLLSGVILVLGMIIPIIVQFIMKKLNHEQSLRTTISLRAHLQQGWIKVQKIVIELNIFKNYQSNERQMRYQRYATRFYTFLIITSVCVFAQYNLINITLRRETILNPSESLYRELEQTYSTGVSCPCSTISIPYLSFITVQPYYHQLCSSYLISPTWIKYIYSRHNGGYYILDLRIMANSQFQTLAMLCEQAQQIINDSLAIFLQTQTVSSTIISEQSLKSEMIARIDDWKLGLTNQFTRTVQLILDITLANQLMNRLNIFFQTNTTAKTVRIEPRQYDGCSCAYVGSCRTLMSIYDYDQSDQRYVAYTIPNFYVGCYLLNSLLLSTLECFYNESCMMRLDQYLDSSLRGSLTFPALSANLNSPNETVQSIVNKLMVNSWSSNISYSAYYSICAPKSCELEYNGRNTLFIVITIVLGIFGGLSIGFKMLILAGLRLIEKLSNTNFSLVASLHSMKRGFSCSNERQMINRLHFILAVITLGILYTLLTFTPKQVIVEMKTPSLEVYERLVRERADTLRCSCSKISIKYQTFLNFTSSFHPVCSRNIAEELAVAILLYNNEHYRNFSAIYGYAVVGQLQSIASVCKLCRDTVHDSLTQFLSSHIINTELFSPTVLSQQIQSTINDLRNMMPKLFLNIFLLIREGMIRNKFMTTYSTNWILSIPFDANDQDAIRTIPVQYHECNCGLSSTCVTDLFAIKIGCYVVEALFQSTLECLYDQECLDPNQIIKALNFSANPTRFPVNSTFETVVNELMIEELTYKLSYTKYFSECAPSSCIYSYIGKSNLIEGVTILISLYGGLVIICRLIAVIVIKLFSHRSTKVRTVQNAWNN